MSNSRIIASASAASARPIPVNPTQVIDIGDHDICVVYTARDTKWLNQNWDIFKKTGQLEWAFKELLRLARGGNLAVNVLNIMGILSYLNVRLLLDRAANFDFCFLYVIDRVNKLPVIGYRRGPKLRPAKDKDGNNMMGIPQGMYCDIEVRDKKYKSVKVYGYP
jgi:hypothetical protein